MSPQSPPKESHEPHEAGTSQQLTNLSETTHIEKKSSESSSSSVFPSPHLQSIVLPTPSQPLRKDTNLIKMRFLRRRALRPYNRIPLPSISCLLPVRENYSSSPEHTTSTSTTSYYPSSNFQIDPAVANQYNIDWNNINNGYMDNICSNSAFIDWTPSHSKLLIDPRLMPITMIGQ